MLDISALITDFQKQKIKLNNEFYSEKLDDSLLNFYSIIKPLPEKQRKILDLKYYYCFSNTEISKELCILRQAVNKNIALNKLKNNFIIIIF